MKGYVTNMEEKPSITNNKAVVQRINQGFAADDTEAILSCVADDVRWEVAGAFHGHW